MKAISLFATLLLLAFGLTGCGLFHHHHSTTDTNSSATTNKPIITPDTTVTAKVVSVNTTARFVVLGFPVNQIPKVGQTFYIYHEGLKAAQVKITGPQQENDIVADLISGEAKPGDTVRDQ